MKTQKIPFHFFIAILLSSPFWCNAQVSETPMDRYAWKKKETEPAKGYVVLKSGTRMEGTIVLKGNPSDVKKIVLTKDGKELSLNPESLNMYGIYVKPLVNDSPNEMYEWRNFGVIMGDTITKSKERRGYAILNDDTRYEGDLYLKRVNGKLDEIIVKTDDGKKVFAPQLVANYGLVPTIADLTNNGKKVYDLEARNFHKGYFVQAGGEKIEGLLAFRNYNKLRKAGINIYNTLYFTPGQESPVTTIESFTLEEVVQEINGTQVSYLPFEEGFVEASKLGNLNSKQQQKLMQPGRICFKDKSVKQGTIAQSFKDTEEFSTLIKFKEGNNAAISLKPDQVLWFEQNINGQTYKVLSAEGIFVPMIFEGKVFTMYRNPVPKSINEGATRRARMGINMSADVAIVIAVAAMKSPDMPTQGWNTDLVSKIKSASDQELKQTMQVLSDLSHSKSSLSNAQRGNLAKISGAIAAEQLRRGINNIVIYNVEYIFINGKSGEKNIVTKAGYEDRIEPLLQSCEKFLFMEKKEQKELKDLDYVDKALKMLDECYSK